MAPNDFGLWPLKKKRSVQFDHTDCFICRIIIFYLKRFFVAFYSFILIEDKGRKVREAEER